MPAIISSCESLRNHLQKEEERPTYYLRHF
jgi:hypothetical protein